MKLQKSRAQRLIAAICVKDRGHGKEALSEHAFLMGWAPVTYSLSDIDVDFFRRDIEAGAINIILVDDVGQLGRRYGLSEFVEVLALCSRRGVLLATPQMIFNPSAPEDWMLLYLNAGISDFHHQNFSNRLRDGRRKAFLGGRWLGGSPPAPYTYCHGTQSLVVDDRQLIDLQRVFVLAESTGPRAIASELGMTEARVRRVLADDRLLFYQAKRLDPQTGAVIQCAWEAVMTDVQAERIRAARKPRKD